MRLYMKKWPLRSFTSDLVTTLCSKNNWECWRAEAEGRFVDGMTPVLLETALHRSYSCLALQISTDNNLIFPWHSIIGHERVQFEKKSQIQFEKNSQILLSNKLSCGTSAVTSWRKSQHRTAGKLGWVLFLHLLSQVQEYTRRACV